VPRLNRLSVSLASTAALALASLPLAIRPAVAQAAPAAARKAETTEAADLGVMGVNLRDAVKFNYGFQGALQGAGTPNQAGLGAFIPLHVGSNGVAFVDVLVNANFSDYSGYSSIINTDVSGTTFSTSTRLGYRWLNSNRSWMFGVNAGYDSRPMATGGTDTGVAVTGSQTVFFPAGGSRSRRQSPTPGTSMLMRWCPLATPSSNSIAFIKAAHWIPMVLTLATALRLIYGHRLAITTNTGRKSTSMAQA
jgi:hypothetical protein